MSQTSGAPGGSMVVRLVGEADIATAPVLRGSLLRLVNRCRGPVLVDLSGLEFIESSGVSAFVAGCRRAKQLDCQFCVASPGSEVANVFDVAGLDVITSVYTSVADACKQRLSLEAVSVEQAQVPIETFLAARPRVES